MNYLLFSHLLEQSKPLTLVTLGILHFRHFSCGSAALCNVAAIHELPLHIITEAFSTIDVFKKLNCYREMLFTPMVMVLPIK